MFSLFNFFQLNSVPNSFNSFGNVLVLVLSNNTNTFIFKSDTVIVPSNSYNLALYIMFTFNSGILLADNSHKLFDYHRGFICRSANLFSSFN